MLMTIILVVLKLAGLIDWSWWWVFGPMWIPAVGVVGMILLIAR